MRSDPNWRAWFAHHYTEREQREWAAAHPDDWEVC